MSDTPPKRPAADRRAAQQIHDKAVSLGATCAQQSGTEGKAVALRGLRRLRPQIKAALVDEQARALFFAAADESMDVCDACHVLAGVAGLLQGESYDNETNTVQQLVTVARGLVGFIGSELDEIAQAVGMISIEADEADEEPTEAVALAGAVKRIAPDSYTVRGLGIVYGGQDLVGDTFGADTDLGLSRSLKGMPVYYDHGMSGIRSQIGAVSAYQPGDDGIQFEIELDRHHKYIDRVMQLVDAGAVGLSTGALPHVVERVNGQIKRWIVGEISLTPTPAEPRTLGISRTHTPTKRQQAQPEAVTGGSAAERGTNPIIIITGATKR